MPDTTAHYTPPAPHDLLIAVRDLIRDRPDRHDQGAWLSNEFTAYHRGITATIAELRPYATQPIPGTPQDPEYPVCGTTACVAGWAVILGGNPYMLLDQDHGGIIQTRASVLLNLNGDQEDALFSAKRTRTEVLTLLNELIENPDADLDNVLAAITYAADREDED